MPITGVDAPAWKESVNDDYESRTVTRLQEGAAVSEKCCEISMVPAEAAEIERVVNLLGGRRSFRRPVRNRLEVHEALDGGLPSAALFYFIEHLVKLNAGTLLEKAVGMSVRTFQRHKVGPKKALNPEQSGRAWQAAEILAKASAVFGSQEEAEQWLERPAIGLDQRRPIDLLATPAGVKLVEDLLERIKFGVYA